MSSLLTIGRSGLAVNSRAMETVSNNIANAENPDYVRRTTRIADQTVTGALNPLYVSQTGLAGAAVVGIARAGDEFLEASARLSGATLVRAETAASWLTSVETGLDNGGRDIGARLTQVYARGEELAAAPFDEALRATFLSDIGNTIGAFRSTAGNIGFSLDQMRESAMSQTAALNQGLNELARINVDLLRSRPGSDGEAALLDQRDASLAAITERLDVDISFGDKGIATLRYGGEDVVVRGDAATLSLNENADRSLQVLINGTATRTPGNGLLAGLSDAMVQAGARLDSLDALAQQFSNDINGWQAAGRTDAGAAGAPLVAITAGAASLTLLSADPAALALASTDGTANGNILGLSAQRGAGGTEQGWTTIMATHANLLATARSEESTAAALDRNARSARDESAAVDIDRETADLIRLQQAYEASARIIQVARETMQSILAIF
ncbi:MAG: flagellar basal body rod C-terminal domain-containing protein [Pseudomonadota bacterium]